MVGRKRKIKPNFVAPQLLSSSDSDDSGPPSKVPRPNLPDRGPVNVSQHNFSRDVRLPENEYLLRLENNYLILKYRMILIPATGVEKLRRIRKTVTFLQTISSMTMPPKESVIFPRYDNL